MKFHGLVFLVGLVLGALVADGIRGRPDLDAAANRAALARSSALAMATSVDGFVLYSSSTSSFAMSAVET